MTVEQTEGSSSNAGKITIGIIVAVILLVVCVCCVIFFGLTLLGPAVGNVFSNIIEELATPVP